MGNHVEHLTFEDTYHLFTLLGATTIPYRTLGGNVIDIWSSELLSGHRKGMPVLRVQWAHSSSTIDEYQWEQPDNGSLRRVISAINEIITSSPSFAARIRDRLSDEGRPLSTDDRAFLRRFGE